MSIAATYASAFSFTVSGDLSAEIVAGMRVKADCGTDGTVTGTVTDSTYASGNGLTTVTLAADSGGLTTNLAGVLHGNDAPDSLVNHGHASPADGGVLSGAPLATPKLTGWREGVQGLGTLSADTTIDCAAGNVVTATIGASLTLSFSNVPASGVGYGMQLRLTNAGAYTLAFPSGTVWPGSTAPAFSESGLDVVVLETIDGGSNWIGAAVTGYPA